MLNYIEGMPPLKKIPAILLIGMLLLIGCQKQETKMENQTINKEIPQSTELQPAVQEKISDEEMKRVELYTKVMKEAYNIENGGNSFIAVRLDSLEGLSDKAKEKILDSLLSLSLNVYSYELIKDDNTKIEYYQGKFPNRAINGTVLSVSLKEYSGDTARIEAMSWFGSLGAVMPEYEASYKNGEWQLKTVGFAIS